MIPQPPTDSGPGGTCREVRDALVRLERAGPQDGACAGTLDATSAHLETCAPCRARLGARLSRLQGLYALRERSAPDGTFDGFFAQIRDRMPHAPAGGGMSLAFLDAPRALRAWRSAALAASLLLAATAGFAFSRGAADTDPTGGVRPLHDPRERLLEAYDTRPDARRVRPVRDGSRRGHNGFFTDEDAEVIPVVGHGAGWK